MYLSIYASVYEGDYYHCRTTITITISLFGHLMAVLFNIHTMYLVFLSCTDHSSNATTGGKGNDYYQPSHPRQDTRPLSTNSSFPSSEPSYSLPHPSDHCRLSLYTTPSKSPSTTCYKYPNRFLTWFATP